MELNVFKLPILGDCSRFWAIKKRYLLEIPQTYYRIIIFMINSL